MLKEFQTLLQVVTKFQHIIIRTNTIKSTLGSSGLTADKKVESFDFRHGFPEKKDKS